MLKITKSIIILILLTVCLSNITFLSAETINSDIEKRANILLNELPEQIEKVIIVIPQETIYRADVLAYERIDKEWNMVHITQGFVGRNGVITEKREGDGSTPIGDYTFGMAFGVADDPGSKLKYTKLTDNDVWVDDVKSKFYNQWSQMDNPDIDWDSIEHLIKYPEAYKYVLSINYNTDPIIPGNGSAIFLHCSTDRPTAGCISVSDDSMVFFLKFVDEITQISILK